jgi:hypothetical protein
MSDSISDSMSLEEKGIGVSAYNVEQRSERDLQMLMQFSPCKQTAEMYIREGATSQKQARRDRLSQIREARKNKPSTKNVRP